METLDKFAGWSLCAASLALLASIGKLDLLIVLLPLSALLTLLIAVFNSWKDNPARKGKKGIA